MNGPWLLNLYQYVGNNPATYTDPFGLTPYCPPCIAAAAAALAGAAVDVGIQVGINAATDRPFGENLGTAAATGAAAGVAGFGVGKLIGHGIQAVRAGRAADTGLQIGSKVQRQMGTRGWTQGAIQQAMDSGDQVRAINKATGNPATRYVHPETGQSVVVDNVTSEVIHVGGKGFKYGPGSGDVQ